MESVLPGTLAVCRLPASDRVPSWALELHEGFVSITRTPDELSIVCPEEAVPPDTQVEEGFRRWWCPGRSRSRETGVLAALATPLAAAGISIFADLDLRHRLRARARGRPRARAARRSNAAAAGG